MTNDLYLVRHGQTLFNRKKMISGWTDSPLTELGLEQARRAGAFLRHRSRLHLDAHAHACDHPGRHARYRV